ncbi:MAG: 4-alpha-glucanotransferase [Acidobacteria bacterium]|nr:4-alpha-glucanotransferase [Acidobacteriota bacterium]
MLGERSSGILLHPSSLPSRGGIGDFGGEAFRFIEFLAAGRQRLWQVLPLSPVGLFNSPYSSTSAFAGNPLLVSLERLAEEGWIDPARLASLPDHDRDIDYEEVRVQKLPLLREAAENFLAHAGAEQRRGFEEFCSRNAAWLEGFVLFDVLKRRHENRSWRTWPRELSHREPEALARASREYARELERERAIQFAFFNQWNALRAECRRHGIRMMGDVAIFVNFDSADVWEHPELFRLDAERNPEVVSGVPPDAFSDTGQYWGNPLYRWDVLRSQGYDWWLRRMKWAIECCDLVRLDHFRGFESYWEIPASETTAVNGRWVKGPGDELFQRLREALGGMPFVAEDLGMITPEVHQLRERLGIPGMRVLQFGFGDPGAHIYLPQRYERNTVVYTGTHDNDTTLGWWQNSAAEHERRAAAAYFGDSGDGIHWAFIRAAIHSVADLAVFQLQDLLGLGSECRMNMPSRSDGNWAWRFRRNALRQELAQKLAQLVEVSDR